MSWVVFYLIHGFDNEEETKIVRRIYYDFLKGDSIGKIANDLTGEHIVTPMD